MKKLIQKLFNKKIEPSPEVTIKLQRNECFCETYCNEYCYTANEFKL